MELGWEKKISLDAHDFLGRGVLGGEVKAGRPKRRSVGLVWDSEEVIEVYPTLFHECPIVPPMDLPRVNYTWSMDPDKILRDERVVGCSTSQAYSPYLRKMISLYTIDKDLTKSRNRITLVWGDRGGPRKDIRATVVNLPVKEDKRRINVRKIGL